MNCINFNELKQMVDFLLQEGVCNILLSFITQVGTNQARPTPTNNKSDALKVSYRLVVISCVTVLLILNKYYLTI